MSILNFTEKKIISYDTKTWPESPDRTAHGSGREAYDNEYLQWILNSENFRPDKSAYIRFCQDILRNCQPFELEQTIAYEKDPVPELMHYARENNIYFEDDTFPPLIWWKGTSANSARVVTAINNPQLYVNNPYITSMAQGQLGNCGFVCAIGCVASHPEAHNILYSSIYPCVFNPSGIYSVRVTVNGKIGYILIDDRIPRDNYSSMTNENDFWYFLIEKTIAKIRGDYSKLGGGVESYFGLDSTSNTWIDESNKEQIWTSHFETLFSEKHHLTYQGTGSATKYLCGGHAYAIIDAQQVVETRLVRLHNPWNMVDYKGPFSPESDDWRLIPDDAVEIFQRNRFITKYGHSTFWMPYDLYISEMGKISDIHLSTALPETLKKIANPDSIQD